MKENACNGSYACNFLGRYGAEILVGEGGCNGSSACWEVLSGNFYPETIVIGENACVEETACWDIGRDGGFSVAVAENACNGVLSCYASKLICLSLAC